MYMRYVYEVAPGTKALGGDGAGGLYESDQG